MTTTQMRAFSGKWLDLSSGEALIVLNSAAMAGLAGPSPAFREIDDNGNVIYERDVTVLNSDEHRAYEFSKALDRLDQDGLVIQSIQGGQVTLTFDDPKLAGVFSQWRDSKNLPCRGRR